MAARLQCLRAIIRGFSHGRAEQWRILQAELPGMSRCRAVQSLADNRSEAVSEVIGTTSRSLGLEASRTANCVSSLLSG